MIKKWRRQSNVLRLYIWRFEIFISISPFAFIVCRLRSTIRIEMQWICACNKQRLIHSCVCNDLTAGAITCWFISVLTEFANLCSFISVTASQAISHLSGSFSAYVQLQVSALANRAVIIDTFRPPFFDLFRAIFDIVIVSIVIEKETLSAHFAAIFIACSTILPEFILAISAFNFGKILWV